MEPIEPVNSQKEQQGQLSFNSSVDDRALSGSMYSQVSQSQQHLQQVAMRQHCQDQTAASAATAATAAYREIIQRRMAQLPQMKQKVELAIQTNQPSQTSLPIHNRTIQQLQQQHVNLSPTLQQIHHTSPLQQQPSPSQQFVSNNALQQHQNQTQQAQFFANSPQLAAQLNPLSLPPSVKTSAVTASARIPRPQPQLFVTNMSIQPQQSHVQNFPQLHISVTRPLDRQQHHAQQGTHALNQTTSPTDDLQAVLASPHTADQIQAVSHSPQAHQRFEQQIKAQSSHQQVFTFPQYHQQINSPPDVPQFSVQTSSQDKPSSALPKIFPRPSQQSFTVPSVNLPSSQFPVPTTTTTTTKTIRGQLSHHQSTMMHENKKSAQPKLAPQLTTETGANSNEVGEDDLVLGGDLHGGDPMGNTGELQNNVAAIENANAVNQAASSVYYLKWRRHQTEEKLGKSQMGYNDWRTITENRFMKHSHKYRLGATVYNSTTVTKEQIEDIIPKQASCIFHILDRRINFDAFDRDASFYSLIRAWVQDDPFRYTPPVGSNLLEFVSLPSQTRVEGPLLSEDVEEDECQPPSGTLDVLSKLKELEPAPPPVMQLTASHLIKANNMRKKRQSKYKKRRQRALRHLKSMGIELKYVPWKEAQASKV